MTNMLTMSTLRLSCSLLAGISFLAAEAAGIPVQPMPGNMPSTWLDWWNDAVGWAGKNPDDHRTQQISVYGHGKLLDVFSSKLDQQIIGGFDHSILTERGPRRDEADPGQEARTDQITLTIGILKEPLNWDRPTGSDTSTLAAAKPQSLSYAYGLSLRLHGELRGERIQNNWHEVVQVPQVNLPYTKTNTFAVGLWTSGSASRRWPLLHASPGGFQYFGWWTNAAGHITSDGQVEGSVRVNAFIDGPWWALWAGMRGELRAGYDRDFVQESVADNEEGLYATLGGRLLRSLVYETGMNLHTRARYGRIGWVAQPTMAWWGSDTETEATDWDIGARVGTILPDFTFITQLRVGRPSWRHWNLDPSVSVEMRTGQAPEDDPTNASIAGDQITVGVDLEYVAADSRSSWAKLLHPFITVSGGVRREYVRDTEGNQVSGTVTTSGVGQIDAGLRLGIQLRSGLSTRLTVGVSAWQPFEQERIFFNGQAIDYLDGHVASMLALDLRARW